MSHQLIYPELKKIVDEFCLHRGRVLTSSPSDSVQLMEGVLYEAFVFRVHLTQDGRVELALHVGPAVLADTLFGESLATPADRDAVLASLARIDEYCRLQLPDKFLEAYARAAEAQRFLR
ncbi:MAG TPA: hypothetical protein VIJ76_02020 [Galbitalea sp.]